jgi:excisionase family DNA binding protein
MDTLLSSKKEACRRLGGISLRKLDYIIAEGKLPVRKIGRRTLIPVRALEQFAKHDHVSVRGDAVQRNDATSNHALGYPDETKREVR